MADWDLYAIVKSYTSSSSATNTAAAAATSNTDACAGQNAKVGENDLDCLASLTFEDEDPFSFPNLEQPIYNGWQELQNSYKPFVPTTTTGVQSNIPTSFVSDFGGFSCQNLPQFAQQQQLQLHHPPPPPPPPPTPPPPPPPPSPPPPPPLPLPPSPTPPLTNIPFGLHFNLSQQQSQHAQQQQNQRRQLHPLGPQRPEIIAPLLPSRATQSSASRSRKKKRHLKRQAMQVTAESLCNDMWAWRKYGQKPIKGSPYPRNYYRCSSSKGCAARKQVERSNTDPNMFIVNYTGDHTHPRPIHRNSLAGSTRNKFLSNQKPANKRSEEPSAGKAPCSSPLSATSLSPTTPLSAPIEHETANENIKITQAANMDGADLESQAMESDSNGDGDYYEDEDDILIPNRTFNEDMFKDLQELGTVGEGAFDNWKK
ncbi:hypothetical protein P3X46_030526 [Hevea brasiliensis]|uniref:WRKY domain-containing protein n=1 Tax=Hevea brasiliensis TaxID=3981 RepID=A0ABQ9KKD0_HEVBR|nr:probable WRKY transcription factor 27 [Hevea brasiliensis]KAJ9139828.1 hypothetical protein P3X46_030526 [Hevea brasiliensis]